MNQILKGMITVLWARNEPILDEVFKYVLEALTLFKWLNAERPCSIILLYADEWILVCLAKIWRSVLMS